MTRKLVAAIIFALAQAQKTDDSQTLLAQSDPSAPKPPTKGKTGKKSKKAKKPM